MNISETVALTIDWYKRYLKEIVYDLCVEHINNFTDTEETPSDTVEFFKKSRLDFYNIAIFENLLLI